MAAKTDEDKLVEKILASNIQIPPRPDILVELDKLIGKPDNNLIAIGNLINKDVSISAALFKLVNSALYNLREPTDNIAKAISIVGLTQLTNLVKGLSLRKAIGGQEIAYEKFWERSNEIALLSSIIARKQMTACNISVDQAYLAGLFHECGIPILMQRFPEYCQAFSLNEGLNWPYLQEEDKRFNTDHTVVGYLVAKNWNLPQFVCQAIRFHHDLLSVNHAARTLVCLLQTACHLQNRLHQIKDKEWSKISVTALEEIGVEPGEASEFFDAVLDEFSEYDA